MRELAGDVLPDLDVLDQVPRELLLARVPVRLPVVDHADAHAAGMDLLTHYAFASVRLRVVVCRFFAAGFFVVGSFAGGSFAAGFSSAFGAGGGAGGVGNSRSRTVMWQEGLRVGAPPAR